MTAALARWLAAVLLLGTALLLPAAGRSEPDRYLVKFRDAPAGRAAIAAAGGSIALELPPQSAAAALLPAQALEGLRRNPNIELIEEDPLRFALAETVPWGIEAVEAPLIRPPGAVATRKVCIIDSGFALGHEDLQARDISGYPSDWSNDGCGHGTHVAGTIAALTNDRGVVGVLSGGVSLHVVKVFASTCKWSYASTLIGALNRCRDAGANVVSMSLGGSYASSLERSAFADAWNRGVLSVAAAGNGGSSAFSYPGSYPSVVSVAAVDSSRRVASFSQHNSEVDLAAPGVGVLSTVPWAPFYEAWSGTSMATPHVSAVAALVWSHNPAWSNVEVRRALEATALDLGAAGRDDYYGHGLVQAKAALDFLRGGATPNQPPVAAFTFRCTGLTCSFTDASTDAEGAIASWAWTFGDGGTDTARNPTHTFAAGSWTVTLTVTDAAGATATSSQSVTVSAPISGIALSATGRKAKGTRYADLSWTGALSTSVEVYRNGARVVTTANDGAWTDAIPGKGGGSYTYRVCESGGAVCSNEATVVF